MSDYPFFQPVKALSLAAVAARGAAEIPADADPGRLFTSIAALDVAGRDDVSVLSDDSGLEDLGATRAGACFVAPCHRGRVPPGTIPLVAADPLEALKRVASLMLPDSGRPQSVFGRVGIDPGATIHDDARLESGVTVDPGVVIGARAEIGSGTLIGANTTIAANVRIGRGCAIDAQVSISNALIGDRVLIHSGARIGHGAPDVEFVGGPRIPHLGRVIVQDDVEIGANAAIERGCMGDTVIGEGSQIDTHVVVRRDTTIGRHAVLRRVPPAPDPVDHGSRRQ